MGRMKLRKGPKRLPMKVVSLTKETIPEVMEMTGKSEDELLALISFREEQEKDPYLVRIPRKKVQ